MLLQDLRRRNIIKAHEIPPFIPENTHYLCLMGSVAYGCFTDYSDMDIYGWCVPPKHHIFPHLYGNIRGFEKEPESFENWQLHHILDKEKNREYDMTIYGVVKYVQLIMENNPNMIDSLFVPANCVLHSTAASELLRENRHIFLHKGAYKKFKSYAFSQLHKCKTIGTEPALNELVAFEKYHSLPHGNSLSQNSEILLEVGRSEKITAYTHLYENVLSTKKRAITTKLHGYDTKFMYNVIRLMEEISEILIDHTLTLDREDRREVLKSVRRGEWSLEQVKGWFDMRQLQLEDIHFKSTLREAPDVPQIKQILLNILESHYGSLDKAISVSPCQGALEALKEIGKIAERFNRE